MHKQTPDKAFNEAKRSVGIIKGFDNCLISEQSKLFLISSGEIIYLGYDYAIPLKQWYNLGIGMYCGTMYYNIEPQDFASPLLNSSRRFVARVPVYIRRYFPLNNKISFSTKIGAEISELLWGSSFGVCSHSNNQTCFNVEYGSDFYPQFNVLSSIGVAYTLKNNKFILFEIGAGCNILNPIQYKFQYINRERSDDWIMEKVTAKYAKSITFSLKYNFDI